jgi:hypothetical protein
MLKAIDQILENHKINRVIIVDNKKKAVIYEDIGFIGHGLSYLDFIYTVNKNQDKSIKIVDIKKVEYEWIDHLNQLSIYLK